MTMKDCKFSCISCDITNYVLHWKPNFIVGLQLHFDQHISQTSSVFDNIEVANQFFFLSFFFLFILVFNKHQPQNHLCFYFFLFTTLILTRYKVQIAQT
ncbi:hypothetical protein PRUPE_7G179000 [Prunus persica]|uniref:Uncharacterized protein n=1 Tax=Prunus persica TaxID=3760 RepID=A0A251NF27_PRUPE|nr:hypothetical protein PRUPE_7G179000 [Prunus persica]